MKVYKEIVEEGSPFERTHWFNEFDRLHREDGPAVEWKSGIKEWWLDGKQHREDGPAVIKKSGHREWWLNDIEYTKEDHNNELFRYNLKKLNGTN